MMNLRFIPLCLLNRHTPKRAKVKWDGLNFVGICRHCGQPIRRRERRGWAKEWLEPASSTTKSAPSRD